MQDLTLDAARSWLVAAYAEIDKNATYLCDLDSAIGDGDHGANMTRGLKAVTEKLDKALPADFGQFFKTVGMTLLSTVGGAAGPLYGGFFLEWGKQSAGRQTLDANGLATLLEAGLGDIKKRGKAEIGDKTMVDALTPAVQAMKDAGADLKGASQAAATAARQAAEATKPLLAKKGRASYLGERSIGHQDPGATSAAILLETLAAVCAG